MLVEYALRIAEEIKLATCDLESSIASKERCESLSKEIRDVDVVRMTERREVFVTDRDTKEVRRVLWIATNYRIRFV